MEKNIIFKDLNSRTESQNYNIPNISMFSLTVHIAHISAAFCDASFNAVQNLFYDSHNYFL